MVEKRNITKNKSNNNNNNNNHHHILTIHSTQGAPEAPEAASCRRRELCLLRRERLLLRLRLRPVGKKRRENVRNSWQDIERKNKDSYSSYMVSIWLVYG